MSNIGTDLANLTGESRARKLTLRCVDCGVLLANGMRMRCKPCSSIQIDLARTRSRAAKRPARYCSDCKVMIARGKRCGLCRDIADERRRHAVNEAKKQLRQQSRISGHQS